MINWFIQGTSGFERLMDRLMELSEYMVRRIKEQPDKFYLIMEPELVNVSFWYLPKQLRGIPHDRNKEIKLGKVIQFKGFCLSLRRFLQHDAVVFHAKVTSSNHPIVSRRFLTFYYHPIFGYHLNIGIYQSLCTTTSASYRTRRTVSSASRTTFHK